MYTYDTLEFNNEYDEMIDEEENYDDVDDYNETEQSDIKNRFTLEEMENILEWVDQHPNAELATISHRFKKVKYMYYITSFRQYIENNGKRLEKLKQIKEFMFKQFYLKRTIEKQTVYGADLQTLCNSKSKRIKLG
jgi:hypothetical protein